MLPATQSASIKQLLALAYLVVTLPAIALVWMMANSLDYRIEQAQHAIANGEQFAVAINSRSTFLTKVGAGLRKLNVPYSKSSRLDPGSPSLNHNVVTRLSDLRTALIYLWFSIFIIGATAIWRLGIRLNRPLKGLTKSISRLTKNELEKPVKITGPRNIKEMSIGLEKLRLRLQESDTQKTSFIRHISHEIKTPLTSIKEGTRLLNDELLGPINNEQIEVIDILLRSTNELQRSIESLLSYNAAVSTQQVKIREKTDLAALVEKALEKHALLIKQKHLKLAVNINSSKVMVDPAQILTVFENLISNAVKYSPENGELNVSLSNSLSRQSKFVVRDEGPGISPEQREAIFDAFFVGHQAVQTTLKGTGLGLSIAKQYIDAHNGSIKLLKTKNGTAFEVLLS